MVDLIKESSEFINFVMTDEQAQLLIAIGIIGALISSVTGIVFRFLLTRQA